MTATFDGNWSRTAGIDRLDVGNAYPNWTSTDPGPPPVKHCYHGYDTTITVPAGTTAIRTYAINQLSGTSNTFLGTKTM